MNPTSDPFTYPSSINQLHPTTSNSKNITASTDATQNMKRFFINESPYNIQNTDKLNLSSRSASGVTSPKSHVTAANHPCLQKPDQGKLNPELKAAITRYVERKENTPIPFTDYKILLNYFRCPLPEMDLHKFDNDDLEIALKAPGFWLSEIPADRLTKNLCLIACLSDCRNLKYVPLDFKDADLCQLVCENAVSGLVMKYVPEHVLSEWSNNGFFEPLCSLKGGEFLQYIPKGYITDDMLTRACKTTSGICDLIPQDHPNRKELLLSAFEFDRGAIKFIPDDMITPEMSQAACEEDGFYFRYIPNRHKTLDLYRIACQTDYRVLEALPSSLTDKDRGELYGMATAFNASALAYIPDRFKTYDLCKQACLHLDKGYKIEYLPKHLSKEELKELHKIACISSEGDAFEYIPDDMKTDELYTLTLNMWISAIKKNCKAYFKIPSRYRTTTLLDIALKEPSPEFIKELIEIAKKSTDDKLHLINLIERINYQPHTSLSS
ncbi:hypothetical protein [Endozoicomonas sp. GU-1]|uniref:hypothetical protein n=1 Tax=Endozoicomonas sp. GU-1 TaxID=3009078 RepID=UPI0022B5C610|nr:hypothetical protein [Endozoicomonas sp. GU-1]WBA80844.1 hypothetical protein O2T12_21440 [Endozoicomonas sp. GU-1]WBA88406.1 hypothetical protein O3276_10625 [Endozoicomonas sp. GU-1]